MIHAIAAPVIAAMVSLVYFRQFRYTTPLVTAAFVLGPPREDAAADSMKRPSDSDAPM